MPSLPTIAVAFIALGVVAATLFPALSSLWASPPENAEVLRDLVASGEAKLIDVRTPREFQANGLEGAVNIPLQELTQRYQEMGAPDEPVVLYCRSGNRSGQAKAYLERQLGYQQVHDLGSLGSAKRAMTDEEM